MQFVQTRKRLKEARFVKRPQQHREALCFVRLKNLQQKTTHTSSVPLGRSQPRQTHRLAAPSTTVESGADYCHGAELREKPT
jgi:hypothetical protein